MQPLPSAVDHYRPLHGVTGRVVGGDDGDLDVVPGGVQRNGWGGGRNRRHCAEL